MRRFLRLASCLLLLAALALPVFAREQNRVTVTAQPQTAAPGETVTVTVSLAGDEACSAFGYMPVRESEAFTVVEGSVLPAVTGALLQEFDREEGGVFLLEQPQVITGQVFCFTLEIRQDAQPGDYPVGQLTAMKNEETDVAFTLEDATVTVVPPALTEPVIREPEQNTAQVNWPVLLGLLLPVTAAGIVWLRKKRSR